MPWLTLIVFATTLAVIAAQYLWPFLVEVLQWDARRVAEGEIWRLLTGLLVHTSGWSQIVLNLSILLVLGTYVERRWSRFTWFLAFMAGAFAAEAAGIFWYPTGGGNSVGLCGLLGLVLAGAVGSGRSWSLRLVAPVLCFAIAAYLCWRADIHGPPIFAGAFVGFLLQAWAPRQLVLKQIR